ncbi:olfactory receptor 1J1-like [Pelodytes ibericus]
MCVENYTSHTEFVLIGFQNLKNLKILFFVVCLFLYGVIFTENLLIILLVLISHQLHHPMYYFLKHLALCDILFVSNIVPQLLFIILKDGRRIYTSACIFQYYFHCVVGFAQSFILTVMSFNRSLAICIPLHSASIMTVNQCLQLVCSSWVLPIILITGEVILIYQLQFCHSNIKDHFFCDIGPILELSTSETSIIMWQDFVLSLLVVFFPFLLVIVSYTCIFITILGINSTSGRQKAISTCCSHLTVVCIFYGTLCTIYLVPSTGNLSNEKFKSLVYIVLIPFINPLLYSLRSKEIMEVFKKCVHVHILQKKSVAF